MITIECERLERRFAGYPLDHIARTDLELYVKLSNSLRHLLDLTGLERRGPKDITPTIDEYVQAHSKDRPDPGSRYEAPDPLTDFVQEAAE